MFSVGRMQIRHFRRFRQNGPFFRQVLNPTPLNPTPLNPTPATCHQRKTQVALQFSECCAAEVALQHWLFCSADVIFTTSCAAASKKLQCNIEKAALQENGVFLPLSCGFQAPTFRHPRLGPADFWQGTKTRFVPPRS